MPLLPKRSDYVDLVKAIVNDSNSLALHREMCASDLFYLLVYGLNGPYADKDFVFDRCREVQEQPDDMLDLWAREHFKSSIITFALTIFEILRNPEVSIGIFSHTRPIAKGFLNQIKREFEQNESLKAAFPDILYQNPSKEAVKWSEDEGIIVRRKGNPKESTVEAWGVVDGQPTGKHFDILIYDDIVSLSSVATPDMIKKTTDALALSFNLGAEGGKRRFIGTRYHLNDTYATLIERGTATPRIYAATKDGTVEGEPRMMSREDLEKKRRDMGPYVFGAQMLQNPKADDAQGFDKEWLRYTDISQNDGVCILTVDAANSRRKGSDYTSIWLIVLGEDGNRYCTPVVRDKLNLSERADAIFRLHRQYQPYEVRYEQYGLMADIAHIRDRMDREMYHFELVGVGGSMPKNDRIRRLVPLFERGEIYLPRHYDYIDYEGRRVDLIQAFIKEEYQAFPVSAHDDMLDSLARIEDQEGFIDDGKATPKKVRLQLKFPTQIKQTTVMRRPSNWRA